MKKMMIGLMMLMASGLHGASQQVLYPMFQVISDCGDKVDLALQFSNWGYDEELDKKIKLDGRHLSSGIVIKDVTAYIDKPNQIDMSGRSIRRSRYPLGTPYITLPLESKNFPFRVGIMKKSATGTGHLIFHSLLISNDPKVPNAVFMTIEEANSPATILHFVCNKDNPDDVVDWNIVVDSPRREIHKAARQRVTVQEAETHEAKVQAEAKQKGREKEITRIPTARGIPELVAEFVSGSLSPQERENLQRESEQEKQ